MGRIRVALAGLAVLAVVAVGQAEAASFEAWTASRWKWTEGVDRFTDQKISRALLLTVEIANVPLGTGDARIALTCTAGKPVMDIAWSIKVAGKTHLTVEYRFAGRPGRSLEARYVNRTSSRSAISPASAASSPMRAWRTSCACA